MTNQEYGERPLRQFSTLLRRQWKVVAEFLLVGVAVAVLIGVITPPRYTAKAQLLVGQSRPNPGENRDAKVVGTHVALLMSPSHLRRVHESLSLDIRSGLVKPEQSPDDLKLGQAVALKFLPEKLAQDADRRERLFEEVRTARKVSHPNACRVWDIGEADGHQFISMEFVDGEDLASLLRRIGRAPKEKAAQIARQLCAGLAAAHEEGVLHRDLKPANVMIDGRGRVRLTDFGLASMAGEIRGDERAGTPMYMAPELLSGGAPSVQTDIYALGLVLYELFTGKRAYQAENLQELMDLQSATSLTSPASLVDGLDPAVEHIILACLNNDPRQRPQTAFAVAGALPGGDPLAAALAAGETPAPELVAAAEVEGALNPPVAAACLAGVGVGLALLIALAPYFQLARMTPLEMSGDALAVLAQGVLATAGFEEPPVDTLDGFYPNNSYIDFIVAQDEGPTVYE